MNVRKKIDYSRMYRAEVVVLIMSEISRCKNVCERHFLRRTEENEGERDQGLIQNHHPAIVSG